jgi:hypothetical protein
MTDGRLDGDFIPEVSHWHRDHPGWHDHDHFDHYAASAGAASLHGGDGRFSDPS